MTKREEALQLADKMEVLLRAVEDTPNRMPTNRLFLMVARVTYWLLIEWVREH